MQPALSLIEFESVAVGVLAVDRMLKESPIALLRCGSVHPGRYLALTGGTVAAAETAHAAGLAVGCDTGGVRDAVLLADPHPLLGAAVQGARVAPTGEAVAVVEVSTSPGLLKAAEAVLKAVPVSLVEIRLADDLGGKALAIFDGKLADVEEAVAMAPEFCGPEATLLAGTLLPRLDETLRDVLGEGTVYRACLQWEPEGAEVLTPDTRED